MSPLQSGPETDSSIIALFGGTFDPVHKGHLHAARCAAQALNAPVRLMPASVPPHRAQPVASAGQRVAMLRAAIADEPLLRVDTRELDRVGASYTVETLIQLRAEVGVQRPVAIVVGADAFAGLPQWHQWQQLFELAHVLVLDRPGAATRDDWSNALRARVEPRLVASTQALISLPAGSCYQLAITPLAVSATRIREMLAKGESTAELLPEAVINYITTNGLYASQM